MEISRYIRKRAIKKFNYYFILNIQYFENKRKYNCKKLNDKFNPIFEDLYFKSE